jgi:hypothetical protein
MSIRRILGFIVNKVYYFGAFVVICGLICQNLGLESAKKVTIIGLFFEAAIFFFGMFSLEENDEDKTKKEDEEKKKIYYTDGNGNYYLKNPTVGIQGGVLPIGNGQGNANMKLPYNYNGDYVNGSNESYYMPDINSDIKQLKEKIDFLESLRKKQIHNLTAGGYFDNINNDNVTISKTNESNSLQNSKNINKSSSTVGEENITVDKDETKEETTQEATVVKKKRGRKPKNFYKV